MKANITEEMNALLFKGAPVDYPVDSVVVGIHQIPVLEPALVSDIPLELSAFNDRSRSKDPASTCVHFYKNDETFFRFLRLPTSYALALSDYKSVLAPDVSIGLGMPKWQRIKNTVWARQCAVSLQSRGIRVIPSIRWVCEEDYEFVTQGIEVGSVFSVSNYGNYKNKDQRLAFDIGLIHVVTVLKPAAIIFYGVLNQNVKVKLEELTEVHHFPINSFRKSLVNDFCVSETLF